MTYSTKDTNGNIYTLWDAPDTTTGSTNCHLSKTGADGKLIWQRDMATDRYYGISAERVKVFGNRVFICGRYGSKTGAHFGDIVLPITPKMFQGYLAAIDTDGNWLWAINIPAAYASAVDDFDVSNDGEIYIGGWAQGLAIAGHETPVIGNYDAFVAKYDSEKQQFAWVTRFGGRLMDACKCLSLSGDGKLWFGGSVQIGKTVSLEFGDVIFPAPTNNLGDIGRAYVGSLSCTDGAIEWVRLLAHDSSNNVLQMVADGKDGVFFGGQMVKFNQGYMALDGIRLPFHPGSVRSASEVFVAHIGSDKKIDWAKGITGSGTEFIYKLEMDADTLIATGHSNRGAICDGVTYPAGAFVIPITCPVI